MTVKLGFGARIQAKFNATVFRTRSWSASAALLGSLVLGDCSRSLAGSRQICSFKNTPRDLVSED